MKNLVVLIFSFFVCLSCFAQDMEKRYDDNSTNQLYFMGSRSWEFEGDPDQFFQDGVNAKLILPEEFAFTGDEILSYNLTTKEIIFSELANNKIINDYPIFNIYLNDNLLLENIFVTGDINSWVVTDLVLFRENKFYLCYEHPKWHEYMNRLDDFPEDMRESLITIQTRIDERRKEGLDAFIEYLSDRDKIVRSSTSIDDIKTDSPVKIYSSGKTIHINNTTGKNTVVTVYGITGLKVAEQTMSSQTTTLNLPVSGFYIVSVKAENEKPVTAKLVLR